MDEKPSVEELLTMPFEGLISMARKKAVSDCKRRLSGMPEGAERDLLQGDIAQMELRWFRKGA